MRTYVVPLCVHSLCVSIHPHTTKPHTITNGISQESANGPLLFNIYITPLLKFMSTIPLQLQTSANDIQLYLRFIYNIVENTHQHRLRQIAISLAFNPLNNTLSFTTSQKISKPRYHYGLDTLL